MKNENKKITKRKDQPSLQKENEKQKEEQPEVYKIVVRNRRDFIKNTAEGLTGIAGILGLSKILSSCKDTMDIEIRSKEDVCRCHVVCTCDKNKKDDESSEMDSQWSNEVCTCNLVCTCDTVYDYDKSDSGGSSSGGGGGGTYYYTYWYPN